MKITIEGDPKEIAALELTLKDGEKNNICSDGNFTKGFLDGLKNSIKPDRLQHLSIPV